MMQTADVWEGMFLNSLVINRIELQLVSDNCARKWQHSSYTVVYLLNNVGKQIRGAVLAKPFPWTVIQGINHLFIRY